MTDEEAKNFLNSLTPTEIKTTPDLSLHNWDFSTEEEVSLNYNRKIIRGADKILLDRLDNSDWSLALKDIVQMKSEAFRQNQSILGKTEVEVDHRKLIPAIINIQINN